MNLYVLRLINGQVIATYTGVHAQDLAEAAARQHTQDGLLVEVEQYVPESRIRKLAQFVSELPSVILNLLEPEA